jgi:ABC-2 type transport system ATP-binding protein
VPQRLGLDLAGALARDPKRHADLLKRPSPAVGQAVAQLEDRPLALRQLRDILRAVADRGVGIVVSSHILRELDGFVDTVALIQKGRLEVHGGVDEVIARYEVGRRLHEVHVTRGLQKAIEVLRKHEGLVERIEPLHKGEPQPDPQTADRGLLKVRIHGSEERAAHLLRELVLADVEVISLAKVRSDLEDVYQSMGRDEVS